jgi:hypothetical protein
MSTPGISIPATAITAGIPRSGQSGSGGEGGPGSKSSDLTQHEKLMLRGVYEWALRQKCNAVFSKLTLGGTINGHYGIWIWRNTQGTSVELTTPMGGVSSLITCYRSEKDEVFSGVWNRVLEEWNDVSFNAPVTRGWLLSEFGIQIPKPLLQEQLQRLRIAVKSLRRIFSCGTWKQTTCSRRKQGNQ